MLRFENGYEVWVMSYQNLWGASVSHNGEHMLHLNFSSYNRDEVVKYAKEVMSFVGVKQTN